MKMIFFLSSLFLLGCNSCKESNFPDRFYDIQLDNKSDNTIKVYLALEREFEYPDTLIETNVPATGFRPVEAGKSTYFDSRVKWDVSSPKIRTV